MSKSKAVKEKYISLDKTSHLYFTWSGFPNYCDGEYSHHINYEGVYTEEEALIKFVELPDPGCCIEAVLEYVHQEQVEPDNVQAPAHYNQAGIECIEAIEAAVTGLGPEQAYLAGNVIKYVWRHNYKGKAAQDLEKAIWYLERLKGTYED